MCSGKACALAKHQCPDLPLLVCPALCSNVHACEQPWHPLVEQLHVLLCGLWQVIHNPQGQPPHSLLVFWDLCTGTGHGGIREGWESFDGAALMARLPASSSIYRLWMALLD